ncbi:MAG: amidohydrolase family protein [Candidatus Eisenbacteria bacterium]|uniref:Amidohydrolase family protein n=1 Tax=Eiseniibacteriota bacterium TaxID=2212470 RepID=A0A849SH88_UNCEI|nr:amidohydrolase family protein [Candidatus Eisenbacteria bacterium]
MKRAIIGLAVAALVVGSMRNAAAEAVALTGGTVHTVSGATLDGATIVIENGRITAVGAAVAIPSGARIVSVAGKHVYPGFLDANSVLGLTEISAVLGTIDHTEIGDINPNVRSEVEINPESELILVTRANGVVASLVIPRGGAINGTSAIVHWDGWTYEDMTVAAPVGLHVQWPNMNPVRVWTETRTDEEQNKARDLRLAAIQRAFDDARAYLKALDAEGRAGIPRHDRDVKWDAMVKALRGEIPVLFHCDALSQINAVLAFADREKLPRVILVGGADAALVAAELRRRDIAVICGRTSALPRRSNEPYDAGMSLPARLRDAGVRFCISNGGSEDGSAANGRNLPYEAAMGAAYGLPRDEALKSITLYPAQILGVADRMGSIEPGRFGDLVITNGDPLEITTAVEQVWIRGHEVSLENRQTRLFKKYDARPRGPQARPR